MFSRKSDYGLRALIFLAENQSEGPKTLTDIAEQLALPKAFLSKILQQLGRNSIVRSLKGPSGGFVLARSPEELTVREIVSEIDGPLEVFECSSTSRGGCAYYGSCQISSLFDRVSEEVGKVLEEFSLADLVKEAVHSPKDLSKKVGSKE